MRIFSLLLSVALSVGCGGTVVAQQVETQHLAPAKEQTSAVATEGHPQEVINTLGMKLLRIPAGTFTMGSPASEEQRYDGETQHQVTLSKPFSMGRTEVTQGQWKKVMGTEPWKAGPIACRRKPSGNTPAVAGPERPSVSAMTRRTW